MCKKKLKMKNNFDKRTEAFNLAIFWRMHLVNNGR